MQQAIQRVDHVVILVRPENLRGYTERLGGILGVTFDEPMVSASGTMVSFCWDAGLEIIAPTRQEGQYWERLQRHGEGTVNIVFGVADLDEGMRLAEAHGAPVAYEATLRGSEGWLSRFSSFREAKLDAFGDDVAFVLGLSEIVPAPGPIVPGPDAGEPEAPSTR